MILFYIWFGRGNFIFFKPLLQQIYCRCDMCRRNIEFAIIKNFENSFELLNYFGDHFYLHIRNRRNLHLIASSHVLMFRSEQAFPHPPSLPVNPQIP